MSPQTVLIFWQDESRKQAFPGLRPSSLSDRRRAQRVGIQNRTAASIQSAKPQPRHPWRAALASIQSAKRALTVLFAALSLAACSENGKPAASPAATVTAPARTADAGQLARGAEVYRAHCAVCHGERAQGAPNWQKPGPDGKYPPPPLNGTGHDWHHPMAALKQTIRDGTTRLGGSMPAWRDKLSEADIEAVIAWFQSLWPGEIHRAWQDIDRRAGARAP